MNKGVMAARRSLASRVGSGLARDEQETWITFVAGEDRFEIGSYAPSIVRKLLEHSNAEIEWLYVALGDERYSREEDIEEIAYDTPGAEIEGLCAHLPLGALTIKGVPRNRDIASSIVNTPADAEEARSAFGGES